MKHGTAQHHHTAGAGEHGAAHSILSLALALILIVTATVGATLPAHAWEGDDPTLGESGGVLGASGFVPLASTGDVIDLSDSDTDLTTAAAGSSGKWEFNGTDTITVKANAIVTVTGTTTSRYVVVEDGANVTLSDANIDAYGLSSAPALGLDGGATATVVLSGENSLWGNRAGLEVPSDATVTIEAESGAAKLEAIGNNNAAGIGSRIAAGTIRITGGTVEATGGAMAAGIGGGAGNNGGGVIITGGVVEATGGIGSGGGGAGIGGAGIGGGGLGGHGGAVTISGGAVVTATGGSGGADIGGGGDTFNDGTLQVSGGATVNLQASGYGNATINFANCTVNHTYNGVAARYRAALAEVDIDLSKVGENGPGFTVIGDTIFLTEPLAYTLTGSTTTRSVVVMVDGATVTLSDAYIDVSGSPIATSALGLDSGATVTVVLSGENTLQSYMDQAGLHVPPSASVTIEAGAGAAKLEAFGANNAAGIGGGRGRDGGTVTISGGAVVTATGGNNAAGIGGGLGGDGGAVIISGGAVVTATGGSNAPDIGGGAYSSNDGSLQVSGGAALTLGTGALDVADADLKIGECVITGSRLDGAYASLTMLDGAASPRESYWIDDVVKAGTTVTLTADSKTGYEHTGWQATPNTVAISDDSFVMPAYRLAVQAVYGGTIHAQTPTITSQPQGATVDRGGAHTLTVGAQMSDGGALSWQWYRDGSPVGGNSASHGVDTSAVGSFAYHVVVTNTNLSANGSQTATVTSDTVTVTVREGGGVNPPTRYQISVAASPSTGGSVSGGGSAEAGTSHTVTATPAAGYDFVSWTENGSEVSKAASYTFTVSGDRSLTANFRRTGATLHILTVEATAGGTATGGGQFAQGDIVLLTATPDGGYRFSGWSSTGGGSFADAADATTTFTMPDGDVTVTARFARTTSSGGSGSSGSSSGSSTPDSFPSQLALTGLPGTVRVGEAFTLVPSIDTRSGSDGWAWDEAYFSATFNSPATFTPLREGKTKITYTGLMGYTTTVEVEILAAAQGEASTAEPNDTHNPNTGGGLRPAPANLLLLGSLGAAAVALRRREEAE